MSNMVIQLGGKKTSTNKEVYTDLSMTGRFSAQLSSNSPYTVDKLVNVKAVQNSVRQIFQWMPGERVLNPEFGSKLQRYLYEGILDQNIEMIMAEIQRCVTEWEPRVDIDKVVNVQTIDDTENNTVRLDVYYSIKGLTDQQFVYSYYA